MEALDKNKIYTVDQTAAVLQLRRETILRKLYANELRGSKIGRIWRIKGNDIIKFLDKHENVKEEKDIDAGDYISI